MGKQYHNLTEQDQIFIRIMLDKQYSKDKIAEMLKVHRSTIYREVKRNSFTHKITGHKLYWSNVAQRKALARRKRPCKLDNNPILKKYVHSKLKIGWSPWQIEGRLKHENGGNSEITHETIYRRIYRNNKIHNRLYLYLRRKHMYRQQVGQRKHRFDGLSIANRPQEINLRNSFGHWEGDLMLFHTNTKTNLITLRERKSRYIVAIKNENRSTKKTMINIISTLKSIKRYVDSITFDLGSEFANHRLLKDCLGANIYFCDPGKPYQKGTVENGNAVIRCELPRQCDIDAFNQKKIDHLIKMINNRPLKCLDYMTLRKHLKCTFTKSKGNKSAITLMGEQLTKTELENLDKYLKQSNQDEIMSLSQIHGFLYGILTSPTLILPSEWQSFILGDEQSLLKAQIMIMKVLFIGVKAS